MYSLLLMTAMTTGGDAPAFGGRSAGCHGCNGAVVSYGCAGACYGGGCYGGSCYGGSCNGCNGSSCHGFGGSCNGCWGSSSHGCNGSSCHGGYGPTYYHQGCYGSMAPNGGCYGGVPVAPVIMEPAPMAPVMPAPAPNPVPPTVPGTGDKDKPKGNASANITIELPVNATLYVDGRPTAGTGATRQFHTPELPAGQPFYYDMKAEVEVGGRTVVEEMKVVVRAGDTLTHSFGQLLAAAGGPANRVAAK
jgi:uncharacterized protein (TIGR03000 family)